METMINDIKETATAQPIPKTNVIHCIFSVHYSLRPLSTIFSADLLPRTKTVDGKAPLPQKAPAYHGLFFFIYIIKYSLVARILKDPLPEND
jgi:hypothetical protein